MLEDLILCHGKKSAAELLGSVKDRDLWKTMTTHTTQVAHEDDDNDDPTTKVLSLYSKEQ